jgi:catechol 2,3-dioxygenase-like lactoylglutathione lyase family enzyme
MAENPLGSKIVCQVALVVHDIEAACVAWARILGVEPPPWKLTAPADESHIRYHGKSTEARAKLAFFDLGQINLEIIEPVGGPSIWQEHLDEHGQGLHHIAFMVKGMDEVIAHLGACDVPLVQKGDYTGGRYAYLDGRSSLAAILELLENF